MTRPSVIGGDFTNPWSTEPVLSVVDFGTRRAVVVELDDVEPLIEQLRTELKRKRAHLAAVANMAAEREAEAKRREAEVAEDRRPSFIPGRHRGRP